MTDQIIHIAKAVFTPQEHEEGCSKPPEESSYGMAGGGLGAYGFCPECGAILWKFEDHEE